MNKQTLNDAINEISDEYIYEAKFADDIKVINFRWKKLLTVAACFALVLLMIPAIIFSNNYFKPRLHTEISSPQEQSSLNNETSSTEQIAEEAASSKKQATSSKKQTASKSKSTSQKTTSKIEKNTPVFDGAYFTAAEVASVFGGVKSSATATTSYQKIYVSHPEYLNINAIPSDEYLTISHTPIGKKYNKSEFQAFLDEYLPKISKALNITIPEYTIEKNSGYNALIKSGDYYIYVGQNKTNHTIFIKNINHDNSGNNNLVFYNQTVMIDQTHTNTEITNSLSELSSYLSKVFDNSKKGISIKRIFDSYSKNGATSVQLNYNFDDNTVLSSSLSINFDNSKWHEDVIVSSNKLYDAEIKFRQERAQGLSDNIEIVKVNRISLQQAEELLKKGYTFGGNSCPVCQSEQEPVSFDKYDYVSFEYITSNSAAQDGTRKILPFYVFYKYIDTSENQNLCYAKTYVPAFEVSGIEEYFTNKHQKHNTSSTPTE